MAEVVYRHPVRPGGTWCEDHAFGVKCTLITAIAW
jgi:hypothetical protein